ncbi:SRPBCC family protein [Thiorhodovibrio winogradskyi]|nr:SRPBCC family protein [Thiorhodovibrio winogradskyi]
MVKARASILIDRPPEQVFGFIADDFVDNYARWSPEVKQLEALTPGPLGLGSRMRQVRVDQGRRSESSFKVTAFESPQCLEFAESTDLFRTGYWLAPAGGQTRLEFGFELRRLELYMRPFEKLIRVAIQDGAQRVVRNIKTLAERELATEATE